MREALSLLLALTVTAALAGCGTSSATFSSDLDAYHPPGGTVAATTPPPKPIVITQAPPGSLLPGGGFPTEGPVYGSTTPKPKTTVIHKTTTTKPVHKPKPATTPATTPTTNTANTASAATVGPVYGATPAPTPPLRPAPRTETEIASDDSSTSFDNLELVNPSLKSSLDIIRVGADRNDNNLLSVFAGVKNKSPHPLKIEVQTVYKDKAGAPLDGAGSWVPITLKPHQVTQYRSMAISEDATEYLVRIRHADDDPASPLNPNP